MRTRTPRERALATAMFVLGATGSASCFDPVHTEEVAALGDEDPNVPAGELHRPGQPCLRCHGGSGPGSPEFSFAGTIYLDFDEPTQAEGVNVTISDSSRVEKSVTLTTNRVGNFFVAAPKDDDKKFVFPVFVELNDNRIGLPDEPHIRPMITPIGRNGDCGFCHVNNLHAADKRSYMQHVYLNR